jgi:hypothetical protein
MTEKANAPTIDALQRRLTSLNHAVAGLALALTGALAFTRGEQRTRFGEIDVERINIVERDGRTRMAISNKERSPAPTVRGKSFGGYAGGDRPGIITYNDEGTRTAASFPAVIVRRTGLTRRSTA